MFDKTFLILYSTLLVILAHCDDNDNSVEVCTTLTVPKYSTRCPENNDVISDFNERLATLEEKLDQKLDNVLTVLENITNRMIDDGEATGIDESQPIHKIGHSCDDILKTYPDTPSGLYNITNCDGHYHTVYCNMENTCGDKEGGWMRVGYLNMSDPSEQCPSGFSLYGSPRACGGTYGCKSVKFPSYNINYTQVCGRVTGYQKGSPDGIYRRINDINQIYVDGVSITRGSPRQHVWTFIATATENDNRWHDCPCATGNSLTPPPSIGNDYFCESGSPEPFDYGTRYTNDPLWDGKQCRLLETPCCNVTGIPWFNKALEQPTTDYIELRMCADESTNNEDIPLGHYEIYIK